MFSCWHQQLHGFQFAERRFQILRDNRRHVRAALTAGVAPRLLQLREIFTEIESACQKDDRDRITGLVLIARSVSSASRNALQAKLLNA